MSFAKLRNLRSTRPHPDSKTTFRIKVQRWDTVSRALFQERAREEKKLQRELPELSTRLAEFCEKLGKLAWGRGSRRLRGTHRALTPQNSLRAKNLAEFGARNRTLRNRIRPISSFLRNPSHFTTRLSFEGVAKPGGGSWHSYGRASPS